MKSAPATARSVALEALLRCRDREALAQDLLEEVFGRHALSAADRRLATHLTYGVLRRRGTLDGLLRPLVSRPMHQVQPWLWETLRLGAFQLALLTHIPAHAALNETVELAEVLGQRKAKGFINGVLRSLSRQITEETVTGPSADALPVTEGHYRRLAKPLLPDPAAHPVQYLSIGFSWPRWLAERWLERWGWDECVRLGFWFAGPAPLYLRANPLKTSREMLLTNLAFAGVKAQAGIHPQSVLLVDHVPIRELPGYDEGRFVVQDDSAMQAASALNPAPGSLVLDLCAGPGGKTTHLAELMRNEGRIIACDVDGVRLEPLWQTCDRLGLNIVTTQVLNEEVNEEPPAGPFDGILVDVPCSNTGVLGRRPEVRWRLKPQDFRHLVTLQTKLLLLAGERVRPGGAIVYSTCSIEPEENRGVVDAVLRGMRALSLEAEQTQTPGQPADGGYWARLRRQT
jgi:16S rRNA (cytosine967-C5)-methyltransferase